MRKIRIDDPAAAPSTGGYSPAIRVGAWIIISGQGSIGADGAIVPGNVAQQTKLTLTNIQRLVERAGGTMDQIVKCTCFLSDIGDFEDFDRVYREFFSEPLPCRTTVQAGLDGILVEIDAVAYLVPKPGTAMSD